MLIWQKFRLRRGIRQGGTVLGTYRFLGSTVQLMKTEDERLRWTCDCEVFQRQGAHRVPLWCKHISRAAARRSLERMTRRGALAWGG